MQYNCHGIWLLLENEKKNYKIGIGLIAHPLAASVNGEDNDKTTMTPKSNRKGDAE